MSKVATMEEWISDTKEEHKSHKHGLGWVTAAVFLVADLVGGGVVAVPVAFLNTGLLRGIIYMLVVCIVWAYTAHLLGLNWVIMQQRWPIYRRHCRKPYIEMAQRSMGSSMKIFTTVIIDVTLFGVSVVFFLLSSKTLTHFLQTSFNVHVNYCYVLCAVSLAAMPINYLKSPVDFWLVIVMAMLFTLAAVLLIMVGITLDVPDCYPQVRYPPVTMHSTILSLGTFLFAFSGHIAFPTIQHDMSYPKKFVYSVVLAFTTMEVLYLPLSVYGYVIYGDRMGESVIDSVGTRWIATGADLAIGFHCFFVTVIIINPLSQQFEDIFNAPHNFSIERVVIRSSVIVTMLLSGLTLPDFGDFMNLVGSTTLPFSCVALPIAFHLYLSAAERSSNTGRYDIPSIAQVIERTNKAKLALHVVIVLISMIAGMVSAYLAILDIARVKLTYPCYVRPFLGLETIVNDSTTLRTCAVPSNISTIERFLPTGR